MQPRERSDRYADDDFVLDRTLGVLPGVITVFPGWLVFFVGVTVAALAGPAVLLVSGSQLLSGVGLVGLVDAVIFVVTYAPFLVVGYFGAAHGLPVAVVTPVGRIGLADAPLTEGLLQWGLPGVLVLGGLYAGMATRRRLVTAPVFATVSCAVGYVGVAVVVLFLGAALYNFVFVPFGVAYSRGAVGVSVVRVLAIRLPSVGVVLPTLVRASLPYIAVGAVAGTGLGRVFGDD